jgi:hypothetical protein
MESETFKPKFVDRNSAHFSGLARTKGRQLVGQKDCTLAFSFLSYYTVGDF